MDLPILQEVALDEKRVQQIVALYKALSNPVRVGILAALLIEPLSVTQLVMSLGSSQSGISHQLEKLRDRGLVDFTRDGNRVIYRLASEHVETMLAAAIALIRDRQI